MVVSKRTPKRLLAAVVFLLAALVATITWWYWYPLLTHPIWVDTVLVGGVGDTWARLWLRVTRPDQCRLELRRSDSQRDDGQDLIHSPWRDPTARLFGISVESFYDLAPSTSYDYRLVCERMALHAEPFDHLLAETVAGSFTTFPPTGVPARFSFVASSCLRVTSPVETHPVFPHIAATGPAFVALLGDNVYVDMPAQDPFRAYEQVRVHVMRVHLMRRTECQQQRGTKCRPSRSQILSDPRGLRALGGRHASARPRGCRSAVHATNAGYLRSPCTMITRLSTTTAGALPAAIRCALTSLCASGPDTKLFAAAEQQFQFFFGSRNPDPPMPKENYFKASIADMDLFFLDTVSRRRRPPARASEASSFARSRTTRTSASMRTRSRPPSRQRRSLARSRSGSC
jgi:hypothetical protein